MNSTRIRQMIILIVLLIMMALASTQMPRDITVANLTDLLSTYPILGPLIAFSLSCFQAAMPVFPMIILTGSIGVVFGPWLGFLIAWTGSITGATLAFFLARYLGEGWATKYVAEQYLQWRYCLRWKHIVMARVIPVIPSAGINLVSGLSKIDTWSFITASALGKMPFILLYSYLGYNLAKAKHLSTVAGLLLTGVILFYVATLYIKKRRQEASLCEK